MAKYAFDYNGDTYNLTFGKKKSLYDMCLAVYDRWSQYAVYDFIDQFFPNIVEWGICVPCEHESPFDKNDPETCLVCGSSERDDNYELEN